MTTHLSSSLQPFPHPQVQRSSTAHQMMGRRLTRPLRSLQPQLPQQPQPVHQLELQPLWTRSSYLFSPCHSSGQTQLLLTHLP